MAVLNLRDVPDELAAKLKSEAALAGMGYHEYCVGILGGAMAIVNKKGRWDGYGVSGAGEVVSKKIADVSDGGVAQKDKWATDMARSEDGSLIGVGGDPRLPRGGKAQDEHVFASMGERRRFIANLPDGVPCGHAGCLSHLSHPCEGCGRIGGRRPIYNMEDNEAEKKNRDESVPLDMRFSEKWLREMSAFETGGLMACSPEILGHMLEEAKTNAGVAATLHKSGIELDREIMVRWGLAENYKPKTKETMDGVEGKGKKGKVGRIAGGDSKAVAEGNDGTEVAAVATGKPGVDMQALRDICDGNLPDLVGNTLTKEEVDAPDFGEVTLCGFKSYNDIDGETYMCGKDAHPYPKIRHGKWIKI